MQSTIEEFNNVSSQIYKDTKTFLDEKILQSIIATYPSLLIATCDDNFDKIEKGFLLNICKNLVSDDITNEEEQNLYIAEIYSVSIYLILNKNKWENTILNLLASEIADTPQDKDLIESMMFGMAESSEGISSIEKETINKINNIIF